MNLGDIKQRVRRIFGDESGTFLEDQDIQNWANDGLIDIVRRTGCLTRADTSTTDPTTVPTNQYTLASDYLAITKVVLNYQELNYVDPVVKGTGPSVENYYYNPPTGYYTIWAGELFFSTYDVTQAYNFSVYYIVRPLVISGDEDTPQIPTEFHEDIVRYCLIRAKEMEEDYAASDRYNADYHERMNNTRGETNLKLRNSYAAVRIVDQWDCY